LAAGCAAAPFFLNPIGKAPRIYRHASVLLTGITAARRQTHPRRIDLNQLARPAPDLASAYLTRPAS